MDSNQIAMNYATFDTNVLLDVINRLVSEVEHKRFYFKQENHQINFLRTRMIDYLCFTKNLLLEDAHGHKYVRFYLGCFIVNRSYNPIVENCYERITFRWICESITKSKLIMDTLKVGCDGVSIPNMEAMNLKGDTLLVSDCTFEKFPYIKEFIEYLVNYRIEHQLIQITEEQMDEVLDSYIAKRNEKQIQKLLQHNYPQE